MSAKHRSRSEINNRYCPEPYLCSIHCQEQPPGNDASPKIGKSPILAGLPGGWIGHEGKRPTPIS